VSLIDGTASRHAANFEVDWSALERPEQSPILR
jgi:hypothetical protein